MPYLQKKVFDVLYRIADIPFLEAYKIKIIVSIFTVSNAVVMSLLLPRKSYVYSKFILLLLTTVLCTVGWCSPSHPLVGEHVTNLKDKKQVLFC